MTKKLLTRCSVLGIALLAGACGHPEKRVVDQYFNAVNASDNQTLSSFSIVKFDKKLDKWSIVQVSPDQKGPASLPELSKKAKEIDKEIAANKKAASEYFLKNPQVVQIQEAQRKDAKIPGNLQAMATEWEKFNAKDRELKKALAEAKEAVDREKRNVQLSVGEIADLENMSGEVTSKSVDLLLSIKNEGDKPYVMGLRKYEMQAEKGGRTNSRWMIHSLEPKG
jgi:hypothetical protein